MNGELCHQFTSRLPWICRIFAANFEREGLSHCILKEGSEMDPHTLQGVSLLQIKSHHDLTPAALAVQRVCFFSCSIIVGIEIAKNLNVHNAVIVWNTCL